MSQYGVPSYAYNEEKMMAGIRAYREEQRRPQAVPEITGVVVASRKVGCLVHGTENLRLKGRSYVCRICMAAYARRNYVKNREKIVIKKREYYRKLREAA